uniref:NusB/RsmB/TIM44 domain-containing protein n=1 Tax=Opuntia streptacantha TaxID=393608 RepID=A0A7C8ZV38_OPUST
MSLISAYCSSTSVLKFQFNSYDNCFLCSPSPQQQNFPSTLHFTCSWRRKPKQDKPATKIINKKQRSLSESSTNKNLALAAALVQTETDCSSAMTAEDNDTCTLPRIDKSGRFCSPRAARELALLILYASCLEGSDPVRLFDARLTASRELDYEFDRRSLLRYNHMGFGGSPVCAATVEEAEQLLSQFEAESAIEEAVLSAPPKLVYSKLLLRFTRKLLTAVADRWDSHVLVIDKVTPLNWKVEASGRILEFSILHLAMSEISGLGTKQQIVINEAVDLAKRFCDGAAPRIINGCLRTFVQDLS